MPVFAPLAPPAALADVLDEAVAAVIPSSNAGEGSFDADNPRWPDEGEERSFISEQHATGAPVAPTSPKAAEENELDRQPLPQLEDLIARIPGNVRDVLEDLFRAKFNAVRRAQVSALKKVE